MMINDQGSFTASPRAHFSRHKRLQSIWHFTGPGCFSGVIGSGLLVKKHQDKKKTQQAAPSLEYSR